MHNTHTNTNLILNDIQNKQPLISEQINAQIHTDTQNRSRSVNQLYFNKNIFLKAVDKILMNYGTSIEEDDLPKLSGLTEDQNLTSYKDIYVSV